MHRKHRVVIRQDAVKRTALPRTGVLSTVMMNATFGEGIRETIYADNGADTNIMGPPLVEYIEETGDVVRIEILPKPDVFIMAAYTTSSAQAKLTCERAAVIDREVHVRHRTSLF